MKFYKPCITISLLFILLSGCSSSKPTENVSANDEVRKAVTEVSDINSYSDTLRVKSAYILASEINPALFLPYDEFETKSDYSIWLFYVFKNDKWLSLEVARRAFWNKTN